MSQPAPTRDLTRTLVATVAFAAVAVVIISRPGIESLLLAALALVVAAGAAAFVARSWWVLAGLLVPLALVIVYAISGNGPTSTAGRLYANAAVFLLPPLAAMVLAVPAARGLDDDAPGEPAQRPGGAAGGW